MPSRSEMDRPATVTAAVLGVLLIAVSVLLFQVTGPAAATSYDIAWSQATAPSGKQMAASGAQGAPAKLQVNVDGVLPSNATIQFPGYTDGAQPPVSQPASITWSLDENGKAVPGGSGTASCANQGPFTVKLDKNPDVGRVSAGSQGDAVKAAWSGTSNKTATYTLTFTWSRPAGATGPLPLPAPNFSTQATLEIKDWQATANEHQGVSK